MLLHERVMLRRRRPVVDRMMARKIVDGDGCWVWPGAKNGVGYGQVTGWRGDTKRTLMVHIESYRHFVGPIPEGLVLDHICHGDACPGGVCKHRACWNPDHLQAVTEAVNIRRGLAPNLVNARNRVCKRGHDMTVEDAYYRVVVDGRLRRQCRRCVRELENSRRRTRRGA